MKIISLLTALCLVVAVACAYSPTPVTRSAAETELTAALDQAPSDSAKLKIAESALAGHPEDIPVGRAAEEIILRFRSDPVEFFKARAEKSESIAAHYLYGDICGRANGDTVTTAREAAWILAKDPKNFWGHMLAGDAAWNYGKPDMAAVQKAYEDAVAADPSRPEGYLFLGYVFEDQDKWPEARGALDAGSISDPANKIIREQRLTAYAQVRDAKAYFDLAQSVLPQKALQMDLPRASAPGKVTTANLLGKSTVIEYWAFT